MSEIEKRKVLVDVLGDCYGEGDSQLLFHCPKCEHHKKKLSINISKNMFKCWVCDYSGRNIFRLIRRYGTYSNKQKWLSFDQQIEINEFSSKLFAPPEVEEERFLKLPSNFVSLVIILSCIIDKLAGLYSANPIQYLAINILWHL